MIAFRRISSFTEHEAHPDSRSSPMVAGRDMVATLPGPELGQGAPGSVLGGMTDLSGTWRAAPADDELSLVFADADFDDGSWEPAEVPGHWRSMPAFADCDGPLLYRHPFTTAEPIDAEASRWWLVFDGIFYESDGWLDGAYSATRRATSSPTPSRSPNSSRTAPSTSSLSRWPAIPSATDAAKRNITGVFQHWDCLDPEWNPGGIWRPVRMEQSGPVRIRHLRVLCQDATPESATVFLRTVLDTREAANVSLVTSITTGTTRHQVVETHSLAAGENRVEWTAAVPDPPLWWPRSLGDQPLATVEVAVVTEEGVPSDRRSRTLGFRSVRMRNWILEVNGERIFVKGSNHGPTRMALAEASAEELARDVELATEANLDMLRLHAHITRPELYEAADRAGLLLWQDFPLQWGYSRSIRRQARRQAREAVDLLAHHPSVVVWCGHNEPLALDIDADAISDRVKSTKLAVRGAAAMLLPSWNKTVLDHSIHRVFERNDRSRPVIPHSGVLPHPPQLDGTDSHLYFGWYWGDERDFPRALRAWPRLARFVSEFGAQAVPADAAFCEPDRWPDLDWERLAHRHSLQRARFDVYVPPDDHPTFDGWREATQAYQAELIKHHIEALRRIKYRPTGGFLHFCFADNHPSVTWSVLGHDRSPKAGFEALRDACAPVVVVADRLPPHLHPGDSLALDVHVVNDLRHPIERGEVEARLTWPGGGHRWRWGGEIPADGCVKVGRLDVTLPGDMAVEGTVVLDLELTSEEVRAANRYSTVVAHRGPPGFDGGWSPR